MKTAHTPGPWIIREGDEWTHDVVTLEGEMNGEPMYWNVASANGRRDQVDANVRLIAAAPDLLEFAEEVRRSGDTRLASMAIAVIAKAKGGQS